jgi:hypothetical protein
MRTLIQLLIGDWEDNVDTNENQVSNLNHSRSGNKYTQYFAFTAEMAQSTTRRKINKQMPGLQIANINISNGLIAISGMR